MSAERLCNFINGKLVAPESGRYIDDVNPSTGKVIALIPDSDYRDANKAIDAAHTALVSWRKTSFEERAALLRAIAAEMRVQSQLLLTTESQDMGKPVSFMQGDLAVAIEEFEVFSRLILSADTPYYQMHDAIALEHRNCIGVVGLITPWNFPLMIFCLKVAAAIVCGNTCVCKPSELSPMSAARMCAIFMKCGVPNGVINVIHGYGAKAAQPVVESPLVRAISFTGGTVTGKLISRIAAPMLKKLQLELGGKNSSIVFDDCYFKEAVAGCAFAAFLNTGQVCCSGSRILVQRGIYTKFLAALKAFVAENWGAHIGDPLAKATQMGPLVSKTHYEKVCRYFALAKQEGGEVVLGGRHGGKNLGLSGKFENGYFFEPTIITGLDNRSRCSMEEIFGPIATVHVFDTAEEAIAIANSVEYGLGASVWSADARRGQRVARELESGTVWVNCYFVADPRQPFGGFKNSGVGRENGMHSIDFFSEIKAIVSKL